MISSIVRVTVICLAFVGLLFLINAYIPETWEHGFNVPIGKGFHVPWAIAIILSVMGVTIFYKK